MVSLTPYMSSLLSTHSPPKCFSYRRLLLLLPMMMKARQIHYQTTTPPTKTNTPAHECLRYAPSSCGEDKATECKHTRQYKGCELVVVRTVGKRRTTTCKPRCWQYSSNKKDDNIKRVCVQQKQLHTSTYLFFQHPPSTCNASHQSVLVDEPSRNVRMNVGSSSASPYTLKHRLITFVATKLASASSAA